MTKETTVAMIKEKVAELINLNSYDLACSKVFIDYQSIVNEFACLKMQAITKGRPIFEAVCEVDERMNCLFEKAIHTLIENYSGNSILYYAQMYAAAKKTISETEEFIEAYEEVSA